MDCVPTMRYCYNCGKLLHSVRSADNTAKFACTCGVKIFSKIKSRRKEEVMVWLPYDSFIADARITAKRD
ncbi:MAG: hypothetical protein J6A79_04460 [Clostridia bacterium]|nr:hypothetical protein [Clostridia bacterium]